ncbi:MAG: hypothetical protein KDD73_09105 [Anaerolineales bacterium]|nr:hypothetical protein [Anaerolineales bacterium]MCB9172245.1 hypothetical protein [Ardenticatenales bacterium]
MNNIITTGAPPYYAYLEHSDGSWYMVWMTRTYPKTSRGHPWHVHMRWSKWGARKPPRHWRWWEQLWGRTNRDFHDPNEAVNEFYFNRYQPRLDNGYRLVQGHLAPGWTPREIAVPLRLAA